jgi:hypothetical protein
MKVDVPLILMPTMTETWRTPRPATDIAVPTEDSRGSIRIYEVAGMAHNDSRINPVYDPDHADIR